MCRQIPIWLALYTIIHRRVAAFPQGWPAGRGNVRGFDRPPYMVQDVADFSAVGDEGVDAHLPPANCGTTGEKLVDSCNQHRQRIVRSMLSWCMFGRGSNWIAQRQGAVCPAARGSCLGRRTDRHWSTQARPQNARQWFGRAAYARGGSGCKALVLRPLARSHENALAMGVRWRAWGGA